MVHQNLLPEEAAVWSLEKCERVESWSRCPVHSSGRINPRMDLLSSLPQATAQFKELKFRIPECRVESQQYRGPKSCLSDRVPQINSHLFILNFMRKGLYTYVAKLVLRDLIVPNHWHTHTHTIYFLF